MISLMPVSIALRPQPLGVFPGIAGSLLLPPAPAGEEALAALMKGRLPERWPEAWQFFARAVGGYTEAAVLEAVPEGNEGIFNRAVLQPAPEVYTWARERLGGEYRLLLDAVAWRAGLRPEPPDVPPEVDGELRAFLLECRAHAALERGAREEGALALKAAAEAAEAVSPVLAARLLGEWAAVRHAAGDAGEEVIRGYRRALELLDGTGLAELRAELWFQLGAVYQSRGGEGGKGALLEAARCYQEALKVFRRDTYPEAYALTQMNLALVYLAMPQHDRSWPVRAAVAVQALREALRVFRRETHPEMWASATLNLANALQHLPSSHPEDNLWEAVALYEEVLAVRRPEDDPVGYARVLANQGNALAHLGALSQAESRLQEARRLFLEHGEAEAADAVDRVLAEIAQLRTAGDRAVGRVQSGGAS
ncbi:tetratricopeptide repeat protein [Thermus scotoductus]|nr:tetratricopeptide repeat protein [Thermus scotoductus]